MAHIKIYKETVKGKAADVRTYRGEHDAIMNKLGTLVYDLNSIWKGDAQTAFLNKYEEMKPTFAKFSELLEEYATFLDTAANSFESKDIELKGATSQHSI